VQPSARAAAHDHLSERSSARLHLRATCRWVCLTGDSRLNGAEGCRRDALCPSAGLRLSDRRRSGLLCILLRFLVINVSLKDGLEQIDGPLWRERHLHAMNLLSAPGDSTRCSII